LIAFTRSAISSFLITATVDYIGSPCGSKTLRRRCFCWVISRLETSRMFNSCFCHACLPQVFDLMFYIPSGESKLLMIFGSILSRRPPTLSCSQASVELINTTCKHHKQHLSNNLSPSNAIITHKTFHSSFARYYHYIWQLEW